MEFPTQTQNISLPVVTPVKAGTDVANGIPPNRSTARNGTTAWSPNGDTKKSPSSVASFSAEGKRTPSNGLTRGPAENKWKHPYYSNINKNVTSDFLTNIKSTAVSSAGDSNAKWKQASTVHAELAALKQRGLAKILNQHFTETAQQLAREKAAADAALQDLQERKARTSEFHASTQAELSPLDQACIHANQWRAECRRKERETLLLYQRYVHKFGSTQVLPLPTVLSASLPSQNKMPSAPPKPPATLVPNMAAQIENTLEEYCARGAIPHPSIITHGTEETFASLAQKEEGAFRDYYRRQLEAKGADAVCSPGFYKGNGTLPDVFTRNVDEAILAGAAAAANEMGEESERRGLGDEYMDYDDDDLDMCSLVSGLTTLHSAMTREFLHDCEHSVQTFLREEQEHVRKIMEHEDYDAASDAHVSHAVQHSDATAQAAESMVQQMQDILHEFQKSHAITVGAVSDDKVSTEKKYPRPYLINSENEEWMVYYDEFYRQEYYHEVHTNRTQWEPPLDRDASYSHSSSTDVISVSHGGDDLFLLDDRMESIMEQSESRVLAYRRRQRRKRRRRRILLTVQALVLSFALFGGWYSWQCLAPASMAEKPAACTTLENVVQEQWQTISTLARAYIPMNEIQQSKMLDEPLQCSPRLEDEVAFASMLLAKKEEEDAESHQENVILRRPWGCNIPLVYLFHSRCRRLAHQVPIFDLQALINSMLQ
jgi:hypothetical protein